MELPVEIRLLIYNELVEENGNLYPARCYSCEPREERASETEFKIYDNDRCEKLAFPQIIGVSKQIYNETLQILYSKSIIHVKCWKCQLEQRAPLWFPLVKFPLVKAHDFPTDLIEDCHRHVTNIAITYQAAYYKSVDRLREFPTRWPEMESQILACYENTKHVSIGLHQYFLFEVTFDLVRRGRKPTTERVPDYKSSLVEHSVNDYNVKETDCDIGLLPALEELCDAVILSNARGQLRDTAFAVLRIRCKPYNPRDTEEFAFYLGCDKHSASDEAIETILTGPSLKDERRRPFQKKTLMELAGISDT